MQIIYISNRPRILEETLNLVAQFMPFIDNALVITPLALADAFGSLGAPIPVKLAFDETFDQIEQFRSDHQSLNYYIRTSLPDHPDVEEEFIMSDDDARPMKLINLEFYKQDGKYHAYYFHDLAQWTHGTNSFDVGQRNTYQVLKYLKYPHLSYASHMPQIINKQILRDARQHFHRFSKQLSLCEWGIYFNYGRKHHAEMFHSEQPYQTLCWPDCVTCWTKYVEPPDFVFENYSPCLYRPGGPFHRLDSMFSQEIDLGFKKCISWHRHETQILRGETSDTQTPLRSLLYKALGPLRRLKDVLFIQEHRKLTRLEEKVRNIEGVLLNVRKDDDS